MGDALYCLPFIRTGQAIHKTGRANGAADASICGAGVGGSWLVVCGWWVINRVRRRRSSASLSSRPRGKKGVTRKKGVKRKKGVRSCFLIIYKKLKSKNKT